MRLHGLTLVASVVLLGGVVEVRAQSLADVARQESERRKTVKDGGKVYTNKDLKELPPPTVSAPSAAAPSAGPDAVKDAKPSAADAKDAKTGDKAGSGDKAASDKEKPVEKNQTYWNGRMRMLETTLERDQTYADALQSRINALTTDFVNRDDPAQRARVAINREKAIAELDRLKKAIADGKRAIADFEEEARRAGVPPGWIR